MSKKNEINRFFLLLEAKGLSAAPQELPAGNGYWAGLRNPPPPEVRPDPPMPGRPSSPPPLRRLSPGSPATSRAPTNLTNLTNLANPPNPARNCHKPSTRLPKPGTGPAQAQHKKSAPAAWAGALLFLLIRLDTFDWTPWTNRNPLGSN